MSIVRRNGEEEVLRKKMFGGDGEAEMHVILKAPEEMYGKGRVFNRVVLAPGSEVAWHVHHGDGIADGYLAVVVHVGGSPPSGRRKAFFGWKTSLLRVSRMPV